MYTDVTSNIKYHHAEQTSLSFPLNCLCLFAQQLDCKKAQFAESLGEGERTLSYVIQSTNRNFKYIQGSRNHW